MRIRILKPTWLPGQVEPIAADAEIDVPAQLGADLVALGAAEVIPDEG